ncbi:MAG: hypothetical protein ACOC9T_03875 [Myxococcota bacterium]
MPYNGVMRVAWSVLVMPLPLMAACSSVDPVEIVAVTFNTGTTEGLAHDDPPDDGYTSEQATISDEHYGNGLAWLPAVAAARGFFDETKPDLVAFQEIFWAGRCPEIPPDAHENFYCEQWSPGDPTVANAILGEDYQVACQLEKPDKCAAVRHDFGTFRGCDQDLCLDGLDGAPVEDCGGGSRIGRGVVDLVDGGTVTVVTVHGTSGLTVEDQDCRVRQFEQVFVDLDGAPAASGERNLVMGDFNIDPGRLDEEASAARLNDFAGEDKPFRFVSEVGLDAQPTYAGLFNIDHVLSDSFDGDCWAAGITEGHPPVLDAVYFDHVPIVCTVEPAP